MTKRIPYWHVDAFADRIFTGNQAAVMLLDVWLDDSTLQAIGAENAFAETAFVVPASDGGKAYALRWFTPSIEVDLCGHATLAAGHVLLSLHPDREAVRFATRRSGVLEVRRLGSGYELALPAIPVGPGQWPEAVAAMGMRQRELWRSPKGYTLLLLADASEVERLAPDFPALAVLGNETFIATAPGIDTDIVSRVFVPGAGIDEDSVTGAAHAVLTPFWAARLGRERFSAFQASARGGLLDCRLDGARVWLGGGCVTVVEGGFGL
ncbi:MAG: PhzF family phenazine biosynthesis protein [Novosphingobium sp.]